jgi:hypothetical protein
MSPVPHLPPSTDPLVPRHSPVPAPRPPANPELDFWRHFDLEKFAQDWRREAAKRK